MSKEINITEYELVVFSDVVRLEWTVETATLQLSGELPGEGEFRDFILDACFDKDLDINDTNVVLCLLGEHLLSYEIAL